MTNNSRKHEYVNKKSTPIPLLSSLIKYTSKKSCCLNTHTHIHTHTIYICIQREGGERESESNVFKSVKHD